MGSTLIFLLAGVPAIEADIYDSIARDFAGQPVAVDVMARRHTRAADSEQQSLQVGGTVSSMFTCLLQLHEAT